MKKGIVSVFFLLLLNVVFAQQKPLAPIVSSKTFSKVDSIKQKENKLYLIKSDYATGFQDKDLMYVIHPIFKQGSATLICDSANYYPSRSYFEAFGNVHINHADTTNVFSDKLEYDGNTKQAYLTQNVQLVNPSSTLSTDVLLYNLGTKIGTYTQGGTLENKSVTINSKNGYYFGNTQDVYFRYNVIARTKQTTIKSDTLRFNSNSNIAFFYGPTNIYGKDDQMYTENGTYNTKLEQAFFGKNNLYNQGSKFLKGDSLFYDGQKGFGKAIKNIKFLDTVERIEMYGQQAYYYKKNKYTLVTDKAFLVMATKDTIEKSDSLHRNKPIVLDSIWMAADTLSTQMVSKDSINVVSRIKIKSDDEIVEEAPDVNSNASQEENEAPPNGLKKATEAEVNMREGLANRKRENRRNKPPVTPDVPERKMVEKPQKDTVNLKDSLKTKILEDTTIKDSLKTVLQGIDTVLQDTLETDTSEAARLGIKLQIPNNLRLSKNKNVDYGTVKQGGSVDSLGNFVPKIDKKETPDSLLARVITAYHNVKIFKHNAQSKADSIYYNSVDSTIRCFINPIIWSNKSQLTADTIFIQLRDKKLYAVHAFKNTFLSQVEERDTMKFNQAKGKEMIGLFDKGKVKNYFIDGNAESMYYVKKDSLTFSGLNQTVSGRIKIDFENGKIVKITPISNVDGKMYPMIQLPESKEMKGFSWKPKERPDSKNAIIPAGLPKNALEKIVPFFKSDIKEVEKLRPK